MIGGWWLALAGLLIAQTPPAAPAERPVLSVEAYLGELARIDKAIDQLDDRVPEAAEPLLSTLPDHWIVATAAGEYRIGAVWLRDGLRQWRRHPTPAQRQELSRRLRDDAREAGAPPAAPALTEARGKLDTILSAREFRHVQGPGAMARLRQRVMQWLIQLLGRLVGSSSVPTVTRWLVIGLVVVSVTTVGWWMYRALRRRSPLEARPLALVAPRSRFWRDLLADARGAADRADWREAVHLAYWTAIAFLESEGAWRPDPSRTPREYVRLVATSHAARAPLEAMTRLLEQVWYAAAQADAEKFNRALTALEQLGCLSR